MHSANGKGSGGGKEPFLPFLRGRILLAPFLPLFPLFWESDVPAVPFFCICIFFLLTTKSTLLTGGTADGGSGQDLGEGRQYDGGRGGGPETDEDLLGIGRSRPGPTFLGEHWGAPHLGEHWGPARSRYLQGPWVPHPEELDRCVSRCLLYYLPFDLVPSLLPSQFYLLCPFSSSLTFKLSSSFSSSTVHSAH